MAQIWSASSSLSTPAQVDNVLSLEICMRNGEADSFTPHTHQKTSSKAPIEMLVLLPQSLFLACSSPTSLFSLPFHHKSFKDPNILQSISLLPQACKPH